ncbi:hypothetical protein ARTHROSP310_18720 [Arthrobacter sp. AD-310]
MVCQRLSPEVTDSAPKEMPYSPVAMLMDSPTRTAGDSSSFISAAGNGCCGPHGRAGRKAWLYSITGIAARINRRLVRPRHGQDQASAELPYGGGGVP